MDKKGKPQGCHLLCSILRGSARDSTSGLSKPSVLGDIPCVCRICCSRSTDLHDGYETGKVYFREKRAATAIVAVNSKFALGFMDAANELGLDAPKDFSIIAFNGESFPSLQRISLTTVAQPIALTCQIAFDLLMRNIEMDGIMDPVGKIIDPVLTIRKSCQSVDYYK